MNPDLLDAVNLSYDLSYNWPEDLSSKLFDINYSSFSDAVIAFKQNCFIFKKQKSDFKNKNRSCLGYLQESSRQLIFNYTAFHNTPEFRSIVSLFRELRNEGHEWADGFEVGMVEGIDYSNISWQLQMLVVDCLVDPFLEELDKQVPSAKNFADELDKRFSSYPVFDSIDYGLYPYVLDYKNENYLWLIDRGIVESYPLNDCEDYDNIEHAYFCDRVLFIETSGMTNFSEKSKNLIPKNFKPSKSDLLQWNFEGDSISQRAEKIFNDKWDSFSVNRSSKLIFEIKLLLELIEVYKKEYHKRAVPFDVFYEEAFNLGLTQVSTKESYRRNLRREKCEKGINLTKSDVFEIKQQNRGRLCEEDSYEDGMVCTISFKDTLGRIGIIETRK